MKDKQVKYPQLRFKGFTDPWEERKLGELGKIYTGNTPKTSDLDNWTDNKEGHIWITPTDIDKLIMSDSDRHLSEQGWSKARKIPENSVLITSIASIGKNTINAVPVAFNQQINAIVPEKNDSYFILSAMIKDTARFASVAGQTATAIINKTTFEKFQIATPSYEEQQKIGSFFKQLDDTITLHQRKLAKLKELKQGYLQKMFPKNGAKVPELRFAGFTDDWEQRKLGNELTLLKDGTHGTHQNVLEGPFLLSAKNIKNGKIIIDEITDRKISVEEYNSIHKKFSLEKGDVLLTIVGSIGETAIIENPIGITFQRSVAYLRPSHTILSQFLFTTINGQKFQTELRKRQVVSAQPGIYLGDLSIIPILIPSVAEQEKIGSFFKQLDETIALHQHKLDLLKEQKKGFLQKMFV